MRLLFYAINGVGLGHVRRLLLIAEEIRRKRPEAHILFITNSAFPQMIGEKGFPYVCIPYEQNADSQSFFPQRTISTSLHDRLFRTVVKEFTPDVVVCDLKWPPGLLELADGIVLKTAILLRNEDTSTLRNKLPELKRFDLICVPHTRDEYTGIGTPKDIIHELDALGALFTGPILPRPLKQHAKGNDEAFRIFVTAGGGGWSATKEFLESVRGGLAPLMRRHKDIVPDILTGPLFREEFLFPGSDIHRSMAYDTVIEKMRNSHLAISMAGYNTCNDLLQSGLPAVLVPLAGEVEQGERARYFQKRGCARVVQCKPEAIRGAVEELYRNRSSLEKMRKACASALGRRGTPAIAARIVSLMPQVTRVSLGRARRLKAADFVVAKGTLSKKSLEQLSLLRKRAGFLLLETGPAWLTCPESVKELRALVDAVALQLTRQQAEQIASGRMPTKLRAAITLLKESGPYFEFRIPTTPRLAKKMATVLKQLHREGCSQLQFHISSSIKDRMLERPLSEVRRFMLSKSESARVYCSHTSLVPSEFPADRIRTYREEQLEKERVKEEEEREKERVKEEEEREKERVKKEEKLKRELGALVEKRGEAKREFRKLENGKLLKRWHEVQRKRDALKQEFATLPQGWNSIPDELPPDLDCELTSRWHTLLKERSAVEKEIAEKQELHLSPSERELDALFLEQDAFREGKAAGVTWRQLELQRHLLVSRHRGLWVEHISALDEQLKRIDARKRELAGALKTALEELTRRKQETLTRSTQEFKLLSQNKEVKRYFSLKKQLERLGRQIAALDEKIDVSSA